MAVRSDLSNYDVYGQLWLAVLSLAVEDAAMQLPDPISQQGLGYKRSYSENHWLQRRARIWMDSTEPTVGSLVWICELLNLDPEEVRREYRKRVSTPRPDGTDDRPTPPGVRVLE